MTSLPSAVLMYRKCHRLDDRLPVFSLTIKSDIGRGMYISIGRRDFIMQKKKRTALLLAGLTFILLSGCSLDHEDASEFYSSTDSSDLENENVDGLKIGMDEASIREKYGEPAKTLDGEWEGTKELTYENGALRFTFDSDHKLISYLVSGRLELATSRGIETEHSKEKVREKYGDRFYEREDCGITYMGYFDKEAKLNTEFGLYNNLVEYIHISKIIK